MEDTRMSDGRAHGTPAPSGPINPLGTRQNLDVGGRAYTYYRLPSLASSAGVDISTVPITIKILLENLLRHCDGVNCTPDDVLALARWNGAETALRAYPFWVARVLLQDFT